MGLEYEIGDIEIKKTAPLWKSGVGNFACRCRLSAEMYRMWASGNASAASGGEEYKGIKKKIIKYHKKACKFRKNIVS